MFRRRILPFLILIAALLLDTSVMPMLIRHWALPQFLLVSVIVLGLLMGRTRGLLYGMLSGLLLDILVSQPLGLMTVLFMISGYLSGIAGRKFSRYLLTVVITPVVCLVIYEAAMAVYLYMAGAQFSLLHLRNASVRILIETLICQLLYLFYNRLLRPSWSRYAAR